MKYFVMTPVNLVPSFIIASQSKLKQLMSPHRPDGQIVAMGVRDDSSVLLHRWTFRNSSPVLPFSVPLQDTQVAQYLAFHKQLSSAHNFSYAYLHAEQNETFSSHFSLHLNHIICLYFHPYSAVGENPLGMTMSVDSFQQPRTADHLLTASGSFSYLMNRWNGHWMKWLHIFCVALLLFRSKNSEYMSIQFQSRNHGKWKMKIILALRASEITWIAV